MMPASLQWRRKKGYRLRQEAWERGNGCKRHQGNLSLEPSGCESRLVERGRQPEASLASSGATQGAKRRQRVLMPCDGAPKLPLVESPRRTMRVGPRRPAATAWQGRSRRGLRTGRRHTGVPQELGTPHRLYLFIYWSWSGLPDPKTPGLKSASDLKGATNTGARGGNRHAKETKRGGTVWRRSASLTS
jgi:hypothetical protein